MFWNWESEDFKCPTALDKVKERYAKGELTLEQLEQRIEYLIRSGREDEMYVLIPQEQFRKWRISGQQTYRSPFTLDTISMI